jgi:uncharacterized protein
MTTAPRIPAMDVLRGCAVLGIMWMNVTAFAWPSATYFNPAASGALSFADKAVWAIGFVAVDGKMRGLFSLLFGASMLLFIDKREMAGRNGARAQLVRSAWLLAIGLAHYLLLWWGDILMIYALVGPVALLFAHLEPLALVKRAFLAFLLHFLICVLFVASLSLWAHAAAGPDASEHLRAGYAAFIGSFSDPASPAIHTEFLAYRGGFTDVLAYHLAHFPGQWLQGFAFSAFDTLGFMLLGMAMVKAGFLTGRWDAEQYRRTARHCFLIGLPPMVGLTVWVIFSGFAPLTTFASFLAWSFPFRIPLTVGWGSLVLWLLARYRQSPWVQRLAAAGRMALSNYLGASLLMAATFYGWGLGLFGQVRLALLPLVVLAIWAIMLLWSQPWLNRFAMGPAEWLWRSLSDRQMQKFRKSR